MNKNLIKIDLNQTISRFELEEIKKEKNKWIVFSSICVLMGVVFCFNYFTLTQYEGLISSRLLSAQKLISEADEIRKNYEKYNKGDLDLSISQVDIDQLFDVESNRIPLAYKLEALAYDIPEKMSILNFEYSYDRKEIIITLISEIDKYIDNKKELIANLTNNFMSDGVFNSYDLRPEKDNHKQQEYYKVILTLNKK
tara:strand:+ start:2571 stop:3161 length:591 start_codon:yes stop_codon:yes gene_type:complete